MDSDTILKLTAPALAGIATAGFAYLKDRWERKQEPAALKHATAQVTFWKLLSEAQSIVLSGRDLEESRQLIAKELSDVANGLRCVQKAKIPSAVTDDRPPQLFRRLFFLYPPPKSSLWILRICFYYYFLVSFFILLTMDIDRAMFGAGMGGIISLFLITVTIWWITRYTEKKYARARSAGYAERLSCGPNP